jgi:hypothetical protein
MQSIFSQRKTSDPSAVKLLVMARSKEGGNGVGYTALKAFESVNSAGAVDALLAAVPDSDNGFLSSSRRGEQSICRILQQAVAMDDV